MNKQNLNLAALMFCFGLSQAAFATAPATSPEAPLEPAATSTPVPQPSSAPMPQTGGKSCGCSHMQQMVDTLTLDDTQKAKIKAIKDQLQASEDAIHQQMKSLRVEMNQLIQNDTIDQAKLDDLVARKKEMMGNLIKAKIMAKNQIYNTLNAQQKTQYQQLISQWENQPATCH